MSACHGRLGYSLTHCGGGGIIAPCYIPEAGTEMREAIELAKKWTITIWNIYQAYLKVKDGKEAWIENDVFRTVDDIIDYCNSIPCMMQVCGTVCSPRNKHLVWEPATYVIVKEVIGPFVRLVGELDDNRKPVTARIEVGTHNIPYGEWRYHNATDALLWFARLMLCGGE